MEPAFVILPKTSREERRIYSLTIRPTNSEHHAFVVENVRIDRRAHITVPQQLLDFSKIVAVFQQMRRKRMPQIMFCGRFRKSCPKHRLPQYCFVKVMATLPPAPGWMLNRVAGKIHCQPHSQGAGGYFRSIVQSSSTL